MAVCLCPRCGAGFRLAGQMPGALGWRRASASGYATSGGRAGDPVRRRVVEIFADGELTAGQTAGQFPNSRPAVSRHLRLPREAGLVSVRVEGT